MLLTTLLKYVKRVLTTDQILTLSSDIFYAMETTLVYIEYHTYKRTWLWILLTWAFYVCVLFFFLFSIELIWKISCDLVWKNNCCFIDECVKEVRIHTYPSYFESAWSGIYGGLWMRSKWGLGWAGSGRLRPMEQCGLRLNTKQHLPCIRAVATKQSIILPFQKIKVTYLKEQRIERIILKNLQNTSATVSG